MGKVTPEAIRIKLAQTIRKDWKTFNWSGIKIEQVEKIDSISIALSEDFQYSGKGNYNFLAYIKLMVKYDNDQSSTHTVPYKTSQCSQMEIKEVDNDFTLKLVQPIILERI